MSNLPFIIGGYYLIQGARPKSWMNESLLPPMLWSASRHICRKIPDSWILGWEKAKYEQKDVDKFFETFGIDLNQTRESNIQEDQEEREHFKHILGLNNDQFLQLQKEFNQLVSEEEFGFPNIYFNLQLAQSFYLRYFYKVPNIRLISISLNKSHVPEFIREFDPSITVGESGVRKKLLQFQSIEPYAKPLGFDILGYDYADFHSLLCHSMEEEILNIYGLSFNQYGFFDSEEEILLLLKDVQSEKLGVEEGYWDSWLISEYELSNRSN